MKSIILIDGCELLCRMDGKLAMNYYKVYKGDKVYVQGIKILGPREAMVNNLIWTDEFSPKPSTIKD